MADNFSFGYWLRRQRLARDLRQADLAGQLGVAAITLRKIEADERRPSRFPMASGLSIWPDQRPGARDPQPERAARLLGAEEALREAHALAIWPDERADYEQLTAATRAALSVEACAAAWADGRSLSLEQAVREALAV